MATDAQDGWVLRVLGLDVAAGGGGGGVTLAAATARWRAASELVDGQIAKLAARLRTEGDAELDEIAEYGLNAVTGGFKVPLMAGLAEAAAGQPPARLAGIVDGFLAHLETDETVEACDENPFGVPVAIRGTLLPALAELKASLAA